ncbi:MAG: protein kinase [Polyangiaceae bacterium]|nr:protein kinase [Polyangiaceae bacterium]
MTGTYDSGDVLSPSPISPPTNRPDSDVPRTGYIEHYEIIRPLGAGGMGTVLLARDTKLGRLVAIKFLLDARRSGMRLLAEAQATAHARHENIVVIYDIGAHDGRPYLVLEYLDGRSLRQVMMTESRGDNRALPRGLALDIMVSVVRALVAAHQVGIVHLDLKPENIMLLDSGQVKVLDFGIASFVEREERTRAGTRAYMSPEQWRGDSVDARSDIWAVGIMLYELLDGAHPLPVEQRERVRDLDTPMPSLAETRPQLAGLADVVARCLRKRADERFQSAEELLAALEPWVARSKATSLGEDNCPFAGLGAFQEGDADRFFGRERDSIAVLGRLGRQPLVAIAGPSGAGKSSLVRAGLIPALRRSGEAWDALVVRPGRAPMAALHEALRGEMIAGELQTSPAMFGMSLRSRCRNEGPAHRLLVFVDQFEELYTLGATEPERNAFLACLLAAADDPSSPLRVVLGIRSDFLDRLVENRAFLAQVSTGLYLLPPIQGDGLREALIEPVLAAGYHFEDEGIVAEMLDELSHAKTPLPLLQFSASALWEARDHERKRLTRAAYEAMGGVAGALAKHADAVVMGLSGKEQTMCRAILLRLVTPERTRAIAPLQELVALSKEPAVIEGIIDRLVAARLILVDTGAGEENATVELVHESLIERWPMLGRWLDQSAEDAHFLARLRTAATQWHAAGETPGLLWRDHVAEEARRFHDRHRQTAMSLNTMEERYLQAVIDFSDRARRRRNGLIASAFAVVCAVAGIVFVLALRAQSAAKRADEEAARVRQQNAELALQALKGRNAVRIMVARKYEKDPTLVLAVAREVEPPEIPKDWPELMSAALIRGVAADVWRTSPDRCGYAATFSPDGSRIAVAMDDYTTRILGRDLVERVNLRGHTKLVWSVDWSADGKRVATASFDNTARIWAADGSGESIVLHHDDMVNTAVFDPDGKRVVTAADDKTVRVWSAEDGRELLRLPHVAEVQTAAWSPDGQRIVTAGMDGIVRVWNASGVGKPLLLRGHTGPSFAATFHPDGTRIAAGGQDRTVRVWDAKDGTELLVLRGHEEKVLSVAWSPDGTRIATAAKDQTARIWRADGMGEPIILSGHGHWVYTATWSPDGQQILTTSLDGTQRRWDLRSIVAPTVLRGHLDTVRGLAFSPDGQRVATASYDNTVRVWNADGSGTPIVLRGHTNSVTFVRWSPDGTRFASLSDDGTARLWSANAVADPIVVSAAGSKFQTLDWTRDGERFVTAAVDGWLRLWSKDGYEIASLKKETTTEYKWIHVTFDASGKRVLINDTMDRVVYVWNLDDPEKLTTFGEHESPVWRGAKWSPDEARMTTVSRDGVARIFDVRGLAKPIEVRASEPIRNGFWTPDGRQLIWVLHDGTFRPWRDGVLGESLISGMTEEGLSAVGWSADGTRLLTGAPDGKVRVYRADFSGAPFVLTGAAVLPRNALWSPTGDRIAVHYEDKLAWVWPGVQPFSGLDDERLWMATSYCLTIPLRMQLFGISESDARNADAACKQKVAQKRSTL